MKPTRAGNRADGNAKRTGAAIRDLPVKSPKAKTIKGGGIRLSNHNETFVPKGKGKAPRVPVKDLPVRPPRAKAVKGGGHSLNHNETFLGAAG